jgi:hypothetical protein
MDVPRDAYFKIHVLEDTDIVTKAQEKHIVLTPAEGIEMQVRVKKVGVVTWEPVDIRGHVRLAKRTQMEIKRVAQTAYEQHLGDSWVMYAALYLPIVQKGHKQTGYTEPLWGFWRQRDVRP